MNRPVPLASLLELAQLSDFGSRLSPAPAVWEWLQAEILAGTGSKPVLLPPESTCKKGPSSMSATAKRGRPPTT